jgi:ABC-type branched-subunit amino acid transport system substrate-binding protein
MRRHRAAAVLLALTLVAAGCADRSGEEDGTTEDSTGEGSAAGDGTFGSLQDVCGPQDPDTTLPTSTDAAETQGTADGTIQLGTVADPGYEGRPGLNQEIFDAGEAFVNWCNAAGGINGRQIELTLYDAALTEYQARLGEACAREFAMVGGGAVTDNQWQTTGQECGLVDVPGFAVTPEKAGLTGTEEIEVGRTIQPVPNPSNQFPVGAARILGEELPDAPSNAGILFGDLATTVIQKDRQVEGLEQVGYDFTQETSYNILGEANWAPFAAEIRDADISFLSFVGDGEFMGQIQQALDEIGYTPEVTLLDSNLYDPNYLESAGEAAEGTYLRLAFWPFEEAENNPATQQYIDLVEAEDGKVALLGAQSMSAWLLFAQLASECDVEGDLTRSCILEKGAEVTEWDGAGLHAPSNPSENAGPTCVIVLQVQDGEFTRHFPATPDEGDAGYDCSDANVADLQGTFSTS